MTYYPYNNETPFKDILIDTNNYSVKNIFMFISSKEEKILNDCFKKQGNDFILNFETVSDVIQNDIIRIIVGNDDINNFQLLMDNNIIQHRNKFDECFKIAVINKSKKIINYFLNMGIDICYLNNYAILAASAIKNNVDFLQFVIENGGDIHAQNNTPIILATYINCLDNFLFLIKNGVDIYTRCDDICKIALNRFCVEIIKYLVEMGVDFKQYDDSNKFFKHSVQRLDEECIKLCLDMQLNISIISRYDIQCMLRSEIFPKTLKLLINSGINLSCLNEIEANKESEKMFLQCYDLFIENGVTPKTFALLNYISIE
uniref:Ankyrin repeat-containing protein n=1 Tax=Borely moumouvirus TaxID=2712067 RepID=A0A6G6ABZ3_9VIRU